ncbi:hypothetical protein [Promicromonospora sp. NPDC057488]|uniref:hypothetical protein n=1 Tax=Promicromonospora sp. NPDC057488 TaxID=3346147 RepID=UPI0036700EDC
MIVQMPEPVSAVAEGSTGWESPSVLVPLIVSLVALGGVIFSNWYSGKNMMEAEAKRREAAVVAEDRRHENDLNRARREHMLDVVRDAYVSLEGARRELTITARHLSGWHSDIDAWREHGDVQRQAFYAAFQQFESAHDAVNLLGSDEVRKVSGRLLGVARVMRLASRAITGEVKVVAIQSSVGELTRNLPMVEKHSNRLLGVMRSELHVQGPT